MGLVKEPFGLWERRSLHFGGKNGLIFKSQSRGCLTATLELEQGARLDAENIVSRFCCGHKLLRVVSLCQYVIPLKIQGSGFEQEWTRQKVSNVVLELRQNPVRVAPYGPAR